MGKIRYVISGINKYGEKKEMIVKEYPDDFTKNYFAYIYNIEDVTVYKAKLYFIESEKI